MFIVRTPCLTVLLESHTQHEAVTSTPCVSSIQIARQYITAQLTHEHCKDPNRPSLQFRSSSYEGHDGVFAVGILRKFLFERRSSSVSGRSSLRSIGPSLVQGSRPV